MADEKNGLDKALEALQQATAHREEVKALRPETKAVARDAVLEQVRNGLGDLMLVAMRGPTP